MKALSPLAHWHTMPHPLKNCLLYGSSGIQQCLRLGLLALELLSSARATISAPLVLDMLVAAWEADPCNASLAAHILDLPPALASLDPARRAILQGVCAAQGAPDALPQPLKEWHQGSMAWLEGKIPEALRHFLRVGKLWPTVLEKAGHCLLRLGEREAAFDIWRRVLTVRPWHIQLALTLHDHLHDYDSPLNAPAGPTAVLFYSWNKASDLDAALHSLTASLDDVARVVCLDNGSTDATPDVLRQWRDRLGERFLGVSLPVNIGAAAARNWLASLPQVRSLPFAAYVDDDALLPPDWLRHLARAVSLWPTASAWGCRVADANVPSVTQSGPLHLVSGQPPEVAFSPMLTKGEPFGMADDLCTGVDGTVLAYMRPCASVTGCCHLLRTEDVTAHPFALPFSPSQYDDLERDLRMLAQGRLACYTGFAVVRHAKRTGGGALRGAAYGNALGNLYKLHGLYDADAIDAMIRTERAVLEEDLRRRLA